MNNLLLNPSELVSIVQNGFANAEQGSYTDAFKIALLNNLDTNRVVDWTYDDIQSFEIEHSKYPQGGYDVILRLVSADDLTPGNVLQINVEPSVLTRATDFPTFENWMIYNKHTGRSLAYGQLVLGDEYFNSDKFRFAFDPFIRISQGA